MAIDVNKFNWRQMFNDSQGKTQATLFCGVIGFVTGCLGVVISGTGNLFDKDNPNLLNQCLVLIGISASLLLANTVAKDKPLSDAVIEKEASKES